LAQKACDDVGMPPGTVQLIYRTSHEDGERLVSDPRVGATGYTGSRAAGLRLKAAADRHGKPIYLELSSINPVLILPGALQKRSEQIAGEFTTSCLMGCGQFCTNPGLLLLVAGAETETFLEQVVQRFKSAPVGTLLSAAVAKSLSAAIDALKSAGAAVLVGGEAGGGQGYSYANTLLKVSGTQFLAHPHKLQGEAFGNASLAVVADSKEQVAAVLDQLEGNLTGCVYSDSAGSDDRLYQELVPRLRPRVGRLLNDKMPTGVAVSPAMNHGGPYPATGHPGFTAVGIPASIVRFSRLECYDNVRPQRLPAALQDKSPNGKMWRLIDGAWTQADVAGA
jgi:NADP-dependent aldehyde dehydrogenase